MMKWQSQCESCLQRALSSGWARGMEQFAFLTALLLDSDTRILAELTDRVDFG